MSVKYLSAEMFQTNLCNSIIASEVTEHFPTSNTGEHAMNTRWTFIEKISV